MSLGHAVAQARAVKHMTGSELIRLVETHFGLRIHLVPDAPHAIENLRRLVLNTVQNGVLSHLTIEQLKGEQPLNEEAA